MWSECPRLRIALLAAAVLVAGCKPAAGPPPIVRGSACAACGMAIQDLRYACERRVDERWRVYDSIECLMREAAADERAWLTDYDGGTLHAADSMWVVHGEFPSPMGGGYAAFHDRATAEEIASRTRGQVERLSTLIPSGDRR